MENRTHSCNLIIFWETPSNILEMNDFERKRPVWLFLWQIEANYFTIRHSREIVDRQGSKFEDCAARFVWFFSKKKKIATKPDYDHSGEKKIKDFDRSMANEVTGS